MEAFESLSVPHTSLLSIKSEAPRLFNAPRIQLEIRPTPGGGLPEAGSTRAEFRCAKGDKEPFLRFAAALDKTRERAVNKSRANPEDDFDLRELRLLSLSVPLSFYPSPTPIAPRAATDFGFGGAHAHCDVMDSGVWRSRTERLLVDDDVRDRGRAL